MSIRRVEMGEDDLDDLRHEGWYEDNMRIKKYMK